MNAADARLLTDEIEAHLDAGVVSSDQLDFMYAAVVDAEVVRSADEWARVITSDLNRAVDGIVSAGKNLIAAKADVRHGEWLPMLKTIGISETESKRLRAIAERFSNRPSLDDLPRSVSALYELSRLPAEEIESGVESGVITSDMTIAQARALAEPDPDIHEQQLPPPLPENYMDVPGGVTDSTPGQTGRVAQSLAKARAAQQDSIAEPKSITGSADNLDQPKQSCGAAPAAEPAKRKRRPLPEAFQDKVYELGKITESLERLAADARWPRNREGLRHRKSDVIRARDALNRVIRQFDGGNVP